MGQLPLSNLDVIASLPIGKGVLESVTQEADVILQTQANTSAIWVIPTLEVGGIRQFTLQFRSSANLTIRQSVRLNLEFTASEDVVATNNQDFEQFSITDGYGSLGDNQQTEKLSVELASSVSSATVGEELQLLITVENLSDEPIYNLIGDMPYLSSNIPNVPFTWGNPSRSDYLAPAGNGSASVATATIPFTMFANYPSGFNNTITVQAIDANPLGGSLIVNNDTLTTDELSIRGVKMSQMLTASPTFATVGDEITFTLTVSNDNAGDDTATNLGVIGNYISGTQSLNPIAPGSSQTIQFTHTTTANDIPRIVAWVQVTGTGQNDPNISIDLTSQRTVTVNPINLPDPSDLLADLVIIDHYLPVLSPDRLVQSFFSVKNDGGDVADNTRLRLLVPVGLDIDPASLGSGVYDDATRLISWDFGTLQINETQFVSPIFYVRPDVQVGTTMTFDIIASSTSDESDLGNNSETIEVVVERPEPQTILLTAPDRTWLVADNMDTIPIQLTVTDQSGLPLPNEPAFLTSDVGGITFDSVAVTTDLAGRATVYIQATESGTALITASFNNGKTKSLTIQRRDSAVRIESSPTSIGVGGQANYKLFIVNTATISGTNVATSDLIDLSVTVPPALDIS